MRRWVKVGRIGIWQWCQALELCLLASVLLMSRSPAISLLTSVLAFPILALVECLGGHLCVCSCLWPSPCCSFLYYAVLLPLLISSNLISLFFPSFPAVSSTSLQLPILDVLFCFVSCSLDSFCRSKSFPLAPALSLSRFSTLPHCASLSVSSS